MDETCELCLAHHERTVLELHDGVCALQVWGRVHVIGESALAGAAPHGGLGAEVWTMVLAAKEDQVPCSARGSLDPHPTSGSPWVVGPTGKPRNELARRGVLWIIGRSLGMAMRAATRASLRAQTLLHATKKCFFQSQCPLSYLPS